MTGDLASGVAAGDVRALARAISLVEHGGAEAARLVRALFPRTGEAYVVGVTGAPGAGKSTLVDRLTAEIRRGGLTVAVLAIDPSSPFTGGAILGDRVRMSGHAGDPGVFVRSMATRGHLGGLARATGDAVLLVDACGFDIVLVETVGVGQDEVDIVRTADCTLVLLVPGLGDDVQAMKAGIMEIADIFVVNKADRDGADRLAEAVRASLALGARSDQAWRPPILKTEATTGAGVAEVWQAIGRFRTQTPDSRPQRLRARQDQRLRELVLEGCWALVQARLPPGEWDRTVDAIGGRRVDPYSAAEQVVRRALGSAPAAGETPA